MDHVTATSGTSRRAIPAFVCLTCCIFIFNVFFTDQRLKWYREQTELLTKFNRTTPASSQIFASIGATPTALPPILITRTSSVTNRYVTFGKSFDDGRQLGNQLFNVAAMLCVSEMTGRIPAIMNVSYVTEVEKFFDVQIARYNEEFLCPCQHIGESQSLMYDTKFEDITSSSQSDNRTIWLLGFFQSWKYMRTIDRRLRQHLMFKNNITRVVEQFLTQNIPPQWTKSFIRVGVQVRRGDVLTDRNIEFGYTTPNETYFESAMSYFVHKYSSRIQFIVASNDIAWCREHFDKIINKLNNGSSTLTHNVTYSTGGLSNGEDLALLASCDHVIMSTGTYGWWAAWLAKGMTIYYSDWPRRGSNLASKFKRNDFFPPHWIGM